MLEYRQVYLQSGKWIVVLILPFWQPFQDHTWGLTCASLQCKWLYSMCKEVEYIPPESWPNSYHISAFIRLDNALWFHSVAVEIAVSTKRRKKKKKKKKRKKKRFQGNVMFIISALMPAVSVCGSCVSLYTNLLWWTWVCIVNSANDLWRRLSQSPEHAVKACLISLFFYFFI